MRASATLLCLLLATAVLMSCAGDTGGDEPSAVSGAAACEDGTTAEDPRYARFAEAFCKAGEIMASRERDNGPLGPPAQHDPACEDEADGNGSAFVEMADALHEMDEQEWERWKAEWVRDADAIMDLTEHLFEQEPAVNLPGIDLEAKCQEVSLYRAHPAVLTALEASGRELSRERACKELYEAVVENDRQYLIYLFCRTDTGFALLSAHEKRGDGWAELKRD